jgi:N-acetylglutamate synthase-like GNAT family acetyltransferase
MYQIVMDDDIDIRPDYYPWLAAVYVGEEYRGNGICKVMMEDAVNKYKKLGIKRIYLHTRHENLYERYGWIFLEEVTTFEGKIKRIYYFDIK